MNKNRRLKELGLSAFMACTTIMSSVPEVCYAQVEQSNYENANLGISYVQLIETLISYENLSDWESYMNCWSSTYKDMYNNVYNSGDKSGIFGVESAKIVSLEELDETFCFDVSALIDREQYTNIKAYLVAIDYTVATESKYIYNGINYRIIYVGQNNIGCRVLGCTEAPINLLIEKLNSLENDTVTARYSQLSNEEDNCSDELLNALKIRTARSEGYVINSNYEVLETISETADAELSYYEPALCYELSDSGTVTYGYRPDYINEQTCNCTRPSTVKVYLTKSANYSRYGTSVCTKSFSLSYYVRNVVVNEISVSMLTVDAIAAQYVCSQQYAVWNTIYYSKYPGLGYDLMDTTNDQSFLINSYYDVLTTSAYRSKFEEAYVMATILHMETSSGEAFASHYNATNANYNGVGNLVQSELANMDTESCEEILHHFYDNTIQENCSNTGIILIEEYQDYVNNK